MPFLKKLRAAKTRKDVARILREKPQRVFYLLKLPDAKKYRSFEIPKRNGDKRLINAPERQLKMLQRRLAKVLYSCVAEIEKDAPRQLAHGFARDRSIFTNAFVHRHRRFVLNLDLQDFFPSFNFGRVRGFFIKDKHFKLNDEVATVIAQIACHKNELPQGGPCSPIISNLLGHLLDVRLVQLAKKNKCSYSRYADDITFSTNLKEFPHALAKPNPAKPPEWQLSAPLEREINRAGFQTNPDKTRMQWRGGRQVTTGLIVNEKVNVPSEYYRTARAICHSLFNTGSYHISDPKFPVVGLNKIEGMLGHIHNIKNQADSRTEDEKKKKTTAAWKLYKKFLFFKHFVALKEPLILTEGMTDVIYLRAAIKRIKRYHPQLGQFVKGKFLSAIRFMKYSEITRTLLGLYGGTGDLKHVILDYRSKINSFRFSPFECPVILLIDNDDGAKDILRVMNDIVGIKDLNIFHEDPRPFYHIQDNLYLIKTPKKKPKSCIEDFFDQEWLDFRLGDKQFNFSGQIDSKKEYGKTVFAKRVVRPNVGKIDFSKFGELLERIVNVLDDYEKKKHLSLAP